MCAAIPGAWAAPASKVSVERLFEVQGFDKLMDDTNKKMPETMMDLPAIQSKLAGVPADKQTAVRKVVTRYLTESLQSMTDKKGRKELRDLSIAATQKVYTQEEVDALTKFYESPTGRSIMAKMPQYLDAIMQPMMAMMQKNMQAFRQQKEPAMNREINRIICGKDVCPNKK
ncbi:hypothetical protein BG910_09160 [Neisseria chenwenguii]|uniref:DUF2059 domain-containing protein n=1 Tax=Neisseria chenwenguii TaxID=1853278 RepID=A0A220S308_9NEIS|nr:DUF2059 domain-containing protein [Neisseria chenwenguii]ASK27879.1 hypothetical protein BG910_09160 [Neisseria chenwenguii]